MRPASTPKGGSSRLFAICTQYQQVEGLKTLPAGRYLCANCAEEAREQTLQELLRLAQAQYGAHPTFTVQLIVVSGILHWNYEVQVYVGAGRLQTGERPHKWDV